MNDFKTRKPKSMPLCINDDEIERLFRTIEDKKSYKGIVARDKLLVELALKTAIRRGELANP